MSEDAAQQPQDEPAKPLAKKGRPTIYDEAIMTRILERVATGETLRGICRSEPDYPTEGCVRRWVAEDKEGVYSRYARSRECQAESWSDRIIELADESRIGEKTTKKGDGTVEIVTADMVERTRLQIDARKWLMAKLHPKQYGDKIQTQLTNGTGDGPVEFSISIDRVNEVKGD